MYAFKWLYLGTSPASCFFAGFFLAACFALAGRFLEPGLLWPPWASKSPSYPFKSSKSPSSSSSSFPAPTGAWSSSASSSSSSSSLRFFVFLPFFFSFFLDFLWSFLSFLGLLGPACPGEDSSDDWKRSGTIRLLAPAVAGAEGVVDADPQPREIYTVKIASGRSIQLMDYLSTTSWFGIIMHQWIFQP